jgi:hypothetical protein
MNYGTKFCRLCLKLLLPTILTCSLPFYPYQKDERALPGYLLTRCSFFSLRHKAPLAFPRCFLFSSTLILSFLTLSLSLRLQRVNGVKRDAAANGFANPVLRNDMVCLILVSLFKSHCCTPSCTLRRQTSPLMTCVLAWVDAQIWTWVSCRQRKGGTYCHFRRTTLYRLCVFRCCRRPLQFCFWTYKRKVQSSNQVVEELVFVKHWTLLQDTTKRIKSTFARELRSW